MQENLARNNSGRKREACSRYHYNFMYILGIWTVFTLAYSSKTIVLECYFTYMYQHKEK